MKAGLFDRAEAACQALEGTPFDTEARLALLSLHERSRDWRAAVEVARAARARAAAARSPRASRTTGANGAGGRRARAAPTRPTPRCSARARRRRRRRGRCCWPASGWRAPASTPQALAAWDDAARSATRRPSLLVAGDYARSAHGLRPAAAPRASALRAALRRSCRRSTCCRRWHGSTTTPARAPRLLLAPAAAAHAVGRAAAAGRCRPSSGRRRPGRALRAGRGRAPPSRCSATAAPPAASRPSTTSGNARAA